MNWAGSTVSALWGYQPITRPSVSWIRKSDGNWSGDDRGVSEDSHEAAINFKGTEAELSTLETVLAANRESYSITCGAGEEIFGADVNYSGSLTVVVVQYGNIQSINKGVYSMPLKLRLPAPSFIGSASLANLRVAHKFSPNSQFDISKQFSLQGTGRYLDYATDPGLFKAVFKQTFEEMKAIRRYLLTTSRTASVSFPAIGISKPFGQRMGTGPFTVKVIQWRDLGRKNFTDWEVEITFARVI